MTNAEMTPYRFQIRYKHKKIYNWIMARFDEGKTVYVSTYVRCTKYKPKHRDMFQLADTGVFVQRGKSWECISLCSFEARKD